MRMKEVESKREKCVRRRYLGRGQCLCLRPQHTRPGQRAYRVNKVRNQASRTLALLFATTIIITSRAISNFCLRPLNVSTLTPGDAPANRRLQLGGKILPHP
ncbi:hypothetical protein BDV19DRAFT_72148 [Aspergillus venezuelensis]